MSLSVRVIVPRRSDGGHRDRLWQHVSRQWEGWDVVEGHDNEGTFNRARAINRAGEGDWDVAVITDADTLVDTDAVSRAVEQAHVEGRLVLPFRDRKLLTRSGTERILAGDDRGGAKVSAVQRPGDAYEFISSCQVVPRPLWDAIGGFDERFQTYGGEDDAFHAASIALTGVDAREDRYPGEVVHLWHRPSADTRGPGRRMVRALAERYIDCAWDRERMLSLLAEDRSPEATVVSVLTCPGRPYLAETIASLDEKLNGPIARKIICVDAEAPDFDAFPGWETIAMGPTEGYVKATRSSQQLEIGSGQAWVAHFEDDVVLNRPLDIVEMQAHMDAHPELVQMSLRRQPWWDEEKAAGDMLLWRGEGAFTQHDGFLAHRSFWTTTVSLVRRSFLAANEWPTSVGSEKRFGRQVFRQSGVYGGIMGSLTDEPWFTHIGEVRAGFGY